MVTVQGDRPVPLPFLDLIDPDTGRICVRYVDVASDGYRMLAAYMIRLTHADFEDRERRQALSSAAALDEQAFVARFGPVVGWAPQPGPSDAAEGGQP